MPDMVTDLPKLSREQLQRVGRKLTDRFTTYKSARKGAEQQWLKNLRQVLGQYDPEFESQLAPNKSRAYPKITRVKCVSMVSRLMSLLFPNSEKNWMLAPGRSPNLSSESLQLAIDTWREENPDATLSNDAIRQAVAQFAATRAKNMEREIEDQLQDVGEYGATDYASLARKVVESAVKYSIGVLKGPMTIEQQSASYELGQNGEVVVSDDVSYRPYWEFVSAWDYYPDMSAKTFEQQEGQFQRHVFSRYQLRALAERGDFYGDEIKGYIKNKPNGNYTETEHEGKLRSMGGQKESAPVQGSKYEVIEYWGQLSGQDLRDVGVEIPDDKVTDEVRATLWVLDNVVIKAKRDPFPNGTKVFHQFVFEEDDVNLCGSGLPPIVRDSQMAIANSSRMMLDNAAAVCGPNVAVDYSRMYKGQDLTSVEAFKVWLYENDGSNNTGDPVKSVVFESHIPELVSVINQFKEMADTETFVGPMTGGDFSGAPSEALRNTGNMSMVMGSAALPFRDIVRNFDRFTVSVMHALVQWNLLFNNKPEIDGDMRPVAKGATSLMAKETRAVALDNLATTITEDDAVYIDRKYLIKHRIMSRDLPVDEILVPDNVADKRIELRQASAQAAKQQQDAMFQATLATEKADALKSNSQAQRNLDIADKEVAALVLSALEKGINPDDIIKYLEPPPAPTPQSIRAAGDAGGGAGVGLPQGQVGGV